MIVFVDVETNDLDERKESAHLLEVALVVVDDNLVERAATSVVCKPVGVEVDDLEMPLLIREMHEKSGLLADLRKPDALRRYEAEKFLVDWLGTTFGRIEDLRQIPLAGSTVSFDRRYLRAKMPEVEALFSYRSIDVTCLTELAKRWSPAVHNDRPKEEVGVAHRALDDARHSVKVLRYYRDNIAWFKHQ